MGTVLAVVYAADTIVAYKYYRDSGDWLLFKLKHLKIFSNSYNRVIIRLI